MLRSMTGFGKSAGAIGSKTFSIEVRSLNSKNLDMNLKIPTLLRESEADLRNLLSEKVIRGKVELLIEIQSGERGGYVINKDAFKQYYSELESLAEELNVPTVNLLDTVMKIPDVLIATGEQLQERDYTKLVKLTEQAIAKLDSFRVQEGSQLERDIVKRIDRIKKLITQIKKTEGSRKGEVRKKLKQRLNEVSKSREVDELRLEQELLLYVERLDITEELVRLNSHCSYFLEVVNDKELSKGKKLSFITQEIGREVNTLGSKANDAILQKLVVEMKEELEKIKEQGNNIL